MRVAVVDIGTNSTRLLIADVAPDGALRELHRESIVTRLGDRIDATGRLQDDAMQRVFDALRRYRELIDEHGATATTAVLTSAVRDAANGAAFTATVRERFGLDARTIGGDEEAALTFAGATSERARDGRELLVVDIGGGSTEFVVGRDGDVDFHVSTQAGVVRQTERHIDDDPPPADAIAALRAEVARHHRRQRSAGNRARASRTASPSPAPPPPAPRSSSSSTPTTPPASTATCSRARPCGRILDRLARLTNDERRRVTGLQPDRAPTIVAGVAMLIEVFDAFGLDELEVSEHDILRGAALRLATALDGIDPRLHERRKDGRTSDSSRP